MYLATVNTVSKSTIAELLLSSLSLMVVFVMSLQRHLKQSQAYLTHGEPFLGLS